MDPRRWPLGPRFSRRQGALAGGQRLVVPRPQPGDDLPNREQIRGARDLEEGQLELQAALPRELDLAPGVEAETEGEEQTIDLEMLADDRNQPGPTAIPATGKITGFPHHGLAEKLGHLPENFLAITAGLEGSGEAVHHVPRVSSSHGLDDVPEDLTVDATQHSVKVFKACLTPGEGHELVQQAQAVPQTAFAANRDLVQNVLGDVQALLLPHPREPPNDIAKGDPTKFVPLATGDDRLQHRVGLGRREHKPDVRRGLLQGLQQGVEGLGREHVDLVDDVDLEARVRGRVRDVVTDRADLVDATVRRPVDLHDVDVLTPGDRLAHVARTARLSVSDIGAVQRLRQDASHRGLAHAPAPGEEERVGDPILLQRIPQRRGYRVLAHDVLERLRSILPVVRLVAHASIAPGKIGVEAPSSPAPRRRSVREREPPPGHAIPRHTASTT